MRIRILSFSLMRIRTLPYILMRIRILSFSLMQIWTLPYIFMRIRIYLSLWCGSGPYLIFWCGSGSNLSLWCGHFWFTLNGLPLSEDLTDLENCWWWCRKISNTCREALSGGNSLQKQEKQKRFYTAYDIVKGTKINLWRTVIWVR